MPPHLQRFHHPSFGATELDALAGQLSEAVSIYDAGGIYARIESLWSTWTSRSHVLSVNSGTSALLSMYFGADLEPGSEVIVPAYNFFAAATPLFVLGLRPVLADCGPDGNIDVDRLEDCIGDRTSAICVTHMWGFPCAMDRLHDLASRRGLVLLEDASHAHGAEYGGAPIGSFGLAAAWSLQARKILTSGEGGFLATDSSEVFERAVLLGHHNRRAMVQVRSQSLTPFAATGLGLNLRMHPLGAALVEVQLASFARRVAELREVGTYMTTELSKLGCLELQAWSAGTEPSWYSMPLALSDAAARTVTREVFVDALRASGALDVDIPKTTRCLHRYPSFRGDMAVPTPIAVTARIGDPQGLPEAEAYERRVFKLPVWYGPDRFDFAAAHLEAFRGVARRLLG